MTHQTYGQHCALVRAMEMVGEPWAMLMIRDLLVEPKTIPDFRRGFPQMPADVLKTRIEELERAGVIHRRDPAAPTDSSVFELTEYGGELEQIVVALSRWGMRTLGGMRRDEIVTEDGLVTALRVTFRPEAARGVHINFVVEFGDIVVHACVNDGQAEIDKGRLLNPDLIIEAGPPMQLLLTGEMSPREALETAGVRLRSRDGGPGNPGLLMWFVELFRIPPGPIGTTAHGLVPSMRPTTSSPPVLVQHAVPNGSTESQRQRTSIGNSG
jgi:DNA-binding HxlR family transcriptional regulator